MVWGKKEEERYDVLEWEMDINQKSVLITFSILIFHYKLGLVLRRKSMGS